MGAIIKDIEFYDKANTLRYAKATLIPRCDLVVNVYDDSKKVIAHNDIFISNRPYLDIIWCLTKEQGKGIGRFILEVSEYLLSDYIAHTIYGKYAPFWYQDGNIERLSNEELDKAATLFYNKLGYQIVSKREYLDNPNIYSSLFDDDFSNSNTSKEFRRSIVYKKIGRIDRFEEKDGILVEKDDYLKEKGIVKVK